MLKKRLIGVVTVRAGRAVQSFGYRRWLPLGSVACVVENLDRWGADEILVQAVDRSAAGLGPDLDLVRRLGRLGLRTPLAYAGGIRNAADGVDVVLAGADRVVVDHALHAQPQVCRQLAERLGAQAVIAALPLAQGAGGLQWLDHARRTEGPLPAALLEVIAAREVAELLVIDWRHEGAREGFDAGLLDALPPALAQVPRIAFGGVAVPAQLEALLQREDVAAVALGNILNYSEHAVQACKQALRGAVLRPAAYKTAEDA